MAKGSVVSPLPEPIESIDKYAALLEKIKAMIEEAIDEAFADRENPAEFYELIQQYVTAPTLTKILKRTYQSFMEAGKMFVVQSEGTGDGIYNCYEQKLLNAEWSDTAGDSKFANKNTTSVEVLNLGEYAPHGTYVAALIAGDLLMSWQLIDNVGIIRWVGAPFNEPVIGRPVGRRAKIQTGGVGTSTLSCKLLNPAGTEVGDAITVYPVEHLGTNALSGEVWPDLAAADIISIFKDLNGTWYTTFVFDDTTECD